MRSPEPGPGELARGADCPPAPERLPQADEVRAAVPPVSPSSRTGAAPTPADAPAILVPRCSDVNRRRRPFAFRWTRKPRRPPACPGRPNTPSSSTTATCSPRRARGQPEPVTCLLGSSERLRRGWTMRSGLAVGDAERTARPRERQCHARPGARPRPGPGIYKVSSRPRRRGSRPGSRLGRRPGAVAETSSSWQRSSPGASLDMLARCWVGRGPVVAAGDPAAGLR
jgi:hypothetical protein